MIDTSRRRPLASRQTRWANHAARRLAVAGVTPNRISVAGMVAALVAGGCFALSADVAGWGRFALLILAALFCQVRLVCNLLDGMVAVEGGKGAPDGPFWNEFPDRVSDMLILVGVGIGADFPTLGWAAAAMAVLTAYVRELGVTCGAPADFGGPMAKQHRMALITLAALLSAVEPLWSGHGQVLRIGLWVVAVLAGVTALRRSSRLIRFLKRR
ncbi:CDP-alcohol phosphatidyltransferase family protein [Paracoccus sp. (in: a-proteobacteria)]|uniref:CDP-alcohol phosphatidyltransferase family protein n=1 Tax=Paracoccus sp. TaxID=267 RepID=UPI0035B3757F